MPAMTHHLPESSILLQKLKANTGRLFIPYKEYGNEVLYEKQVYLPHDSNVHASCLQLSGHRPAFQDEPSH
jgi:hypothetical protein